MRVLGIETSCDETGVAIYDTEQGLLSHALYSQIKMHAKYGGVVPELASRDHVRKLLPLVEECMAEAGLRPKDLDGIAYTQGPGLVGALLVGIGFAKSLAYGWGIPALAVHHMEGHLLAPMLDKENKPEFPFVALLVSGGHTQLVDVRSVGDYDLLGESLDDAAGEAFDKTAKLLGLPYPGGPELAKLAEQGEADVYKFTRPMVDRPGLDFSFSGLKTAVRNQIESIEDIGHQDKANVALAFEQTVVDTLVLKCKRALKQTGHSRLVLAGGVSANRRLRSTMDDLAKRHNWSIHYPQLSFCTDNGAMIAYAGAQRLAAGQFDESLSFAAKARWPLNQLEAV